MSVQSIDVTAMFLDFSRRAMFEQKWPRLKGAVEALSDDEIWWRPNAASNSIGNLMLHLTGNVRQWAVASFNRQEDVRNRPVEFHEEQKLSGQELLERLGATLEQAAAVLERLTEADLLASYDIQGYHVTGLHAVYQVAEHFAMHYGQILYIAKQLGGEDLGFYKELDKTGRAG